MMAILNTVLLQDRFDTILVTIRTKLMDRLIALHIRFYTIHHCALSQLVQLISLFLLLPILELLYFSFQLLQSGLSRSVICLRLEQLLLDIGNDAIQLYDFRGYCGIGLQCQQGLGDISGGFQRAGCGSEFCKHGIRPRRMV
ncbi:hypothetical protein BI344_01440 [Chromobacterium sphagni]|uniref:Uncharacterized protein n=1 Tax=Chromobacterium sphagni TaxID=1903179 RepID=A0ABX3CGC8_9NEIS|nr:hypothetical protein BI344_01440 [Chromobacterium sphagni]